MPKLNNSNATFGIIFKQCAKMKVKSWWWLQIIPMGKNSKKSTLDWFQTRADERDREDAISFASRRSLAKVPQPGGTVPRHAINATSASMRSSKRSIHSNTSKKYPPEGSYMGGHHTTYSLWSAQNSLKREHKRKFNRSLCGVLLAFSIVLVILGILGIIGIAVYLGGKYTMD